MGMQITGQSSSIAFEFTCDVCNGKVRDLSRAYAAWPPGATPSGQMHVYHKGTCPVPEGYLENDLLIVMAYMRQDLADQIKEHRS